VEVFQFYLILGVVLIALEIVVPGFVLAPLGLAALATAGVASLTENFVLHFLTFSIVATALFVSLRYWNRTRISKPKEQGTFGLIGQSGLLIEAPRSPSLPGRVKVFADEYEILWDDSESVETLKECEPGTPVRIVRVLGNRVQVQKSQGRA
jgi:membrane protein implicated in regulation of membrane protease activity